MGDYYSERKEFFEKIYWEKDHNNILIPNGINSFPPVDLIGKLNILLKIINHGGNIIDLGCGNGVLLKLLMGKSNQKIIPWGIDFLDKSIQQAREKVLPKFKENFEVGNCLKINFDKQFDYIISDLECASDDDINIFINKCFNALKKNGALIFFIPSDTYISIKNRGKTMSFLKSKNLNWLKNPNMLCCYLSKEY
jgi:ubiquinone/menaquinone biosynthesis C-methylase UbiE